MTTHTSQKLLVSILIGIALGILLRGLAPAAGASVKFLGELFLRALFVMVVPLVMSSMVVGVSALGDVRKLGPLGGWTMLYFLATTGIAVLIGLLLVLSIEPGAAAGQQAFLIVPTLQRTHRALK